MVKIATNILFIEDATIVAPITIRAMRAAGYSVDRASTGEEALKLFALQDYELVVSDVELGSGMDSIETTERLLKRAAVPVLFMTAHEKDEVDRRARAIADCYGYIKKGTDSSYLLSMIGLCLQRSKDDNFLPRESSTGC